MTNSLLPKSYWNAINPYVQHPVHPKPQVSKHFNCYLYCDLYEQEIEVEVVADIDTDHMDEETGVWYNETEITSMTWNHPTTWRELQTGFKTNNTFELEQFWQAHNELEKAALEYIGMHPDVAEDYED
jgi:hypothetical protein